MTLLQIIYNLHDARRGGRDHSDLPARHGRAAHGAPDLNGRNYARD